MSTTPLPPLPWGADFEAWLEVRTEVDMTAALQSYAQQARADLEAENRRLKAFAINVYNGCVKGAIKSKPILIIDDNATELKTRSLAEEAEAALKGTP